MYGTLNCLNYNKLKYFAMFFTAILSTTGRFEIKKEIKFETYHKYIIVIIFVACALIRIQSKPDKVKIYFLDFEPKQE